MTEPVRGGLVKWFEGLGDFWKIAIVVSSLFGAGAASATFASQQLAMPSMLEEHQDSIASFAPRLAEAEDALYDSGPLLDTLLAVTSRNGEHVEDLMEQVAGLVCVVRAQLGEGTLQTCIESLSITTRGAR